MLRIRSLCAICIVCVLCATPNHALATSSLGKSCIKSIIANPPDMALAPTDAENLITNIASSMGLQISGIRVMGCDFLSNAEAAVEDGSSPGVPDGEYILYSPTWVKQIAGDRDVELYAIFGHEFGHLIARHYYHAKPNKHDKEQEADAFAGCAVAHMGGDWATLEWLLHRIRPTTPADYPSAEESIVAAKRSFEACGGEVPGDAVNHDAIDGWIYLGFYEDGGWPDGSILEGVNGEAPNDLLGAQFSLTKGTNLRDGPFKATRQLPAGGCDHSESTIIGGLGTGAKVTVNEIYRLDGNWCQHYVWGRVSADGS